MTKTEVLKALFSENALAPLDKKRGELSTARLKESEDKSPYDFLLRNLPDDALVVKCDKFPNLGQTFFKEDNNECQRADYFVISESENVIMFFELQKTNKSKTTSHAIAQLKGAECVMEYVGVIVDSFLNYKGKFDTFDRRFYILQHKGSRRQAFKETRRTGLAPETPQTRYWERIFIYEITEIIGALRATPKNALRKTFGGNHHERRVVPVLAVYVVSTGFAETKPVAGKF